MKIELVIPMTLPSVANLREHWSARAKRAKMHRQTIAVHRAMLSHLTGVTVVRLGRLAPRKLDGDNLQGAFKAIRDQIAYELGVDDGSDAVTWLYYQAPAKVATVKIEVEYARIA